MTIAGMIVEMTILHFQTMMKMLMKWTDTNIVNF